MVLIQHPSLGTNPKDLILDRLIATIQSEANCIKKIKSYHVLRFLNKQDDQRAICGFPQ